MKFIDLFAGIGGFRMGMERAGHECVGYVEIDKFAIKSYEAIYNTEGEWTKNDITKVTDEEWHQFRGKVDVLCGGFPCQSFSIAGKRLGFADKTRGTLFFEVARAAKEIQPSYLFLENVKGLLNHDKGRTFRTILSTLDECGYDVEWQLCNSKNFGVPQNRERVIIIGHLRGTSTREIFFDAGQSGQTTKSKRKIIRVFDGRNTGTYGSQDVVSPDGIAGTLNTMTGGGREPKIINPLKRKTNNGWHFEQEVFDKKGISRALKAGGGSGNIPKLAIPVITPDRINKRQNGRRFKENGDPMFTINTVDKHGVLINKPTVGGSEDLRIRKLTPRECWRLQGFPDWAFDKAQEVNSNSQLYKQAGNSVTVPLMEFVAKRMTESNKNLWADTVVNNSK